MAKGGTRLKTRWWQTEDGALVFRDLFDTRLSTACSFRLAEDGKIRCMPDVPHWLAAATVKYADSACLSPVLFTRLGTPSFVNPSEACIRPSFVVGLPRAPVAPMAMCAAGSPVFKVMGERENLSLMAYEPRMTGVGLPCVPSSRPSGQSWFADLWAVPPEDLVAAKEVVQEQRGTLGLSFDRSEDGAMLQREWYTSPTHGACRLTLPANEATPTAGRCVPEPDIVLAAADVEYADEACTKPILRHTASACRPEAPRRLGLNRPASGGHTCDIVRTRHDRQEPLAGSAPRFRLADGGCRESTRAAMADTWVYGPAIPLSSQDGVTVKDVGTGRLRVRTLVNEQGELLRTVGFFDTGTGLPCEPRRFEGGVRCVPPLWVGFDEARDRSCRKRFVRPRWPSESCLAREPRFVLDVEPTCTAPLAAKILELTRPVRIDARYSAAYGSPDAGICMEVKEARTPETFFEVKEHALTDFPALQEITR